MKDSRSLSNRGQAHTKRDPQGEADPTQGSEERWEEKESQATALSCQIKPHFLGSHSGPTLMKPQCFILISKVTPTSRGFNDGVFLWILL